MESKINEEKKASSSKKHKRTGFEEWGGYMQSKKVKLNDQFQSRKKVELADEDVNGTEIFKGIAIFVNGYTRPTADELKRLMAIHGGNFHSYYSSTKTTHTIASNLPYSKIRNLNDQIVVTPDWITDSIEAGKLLQHQNYLLYSPETKDNQHRLTAFGSFVKPKASESMTEHKELGIIQNTEKNQHSVTSDTTPKARLSDRISVDNEYAEEPVTVNDSFLTNKSDISLKAGDPNFLSEFYSHSRLHHISTAGQELKAYVQQLAEKRKGQGFSGREKLRHLWPDMNVNCQFQSECDVDMLTESFGSSKTSKTESVIMHLDMDCFFVSVGFKKHPELRGFPVAVTHSKGRGGGAQKGSNIQYEANHYANLSKKKLADVVNQEEAEIDTPDNFKVSTSSKEYGSLSEIASCSYEAREAGLRNGMFLGEALRRCPDLKTMPYDFEGYSEVSKQLYDIVASYTLDIEAVSCDELYIDCTEVLLDTSVSPEKFATTLRAEIEANTGCSASAGLGSNMLLARLATRVAKPNGQYYLPCIEVDEFMKKQKVCDLPGVGYTTSQRLQQMGAVTCSELQKWPLMKLQQEFGPKTGQSLFDHCRGKDNKTVQLLKDRKSVSAEINYGIRFESEADISNFIEELSTEVHKRLQNIGKKGKSLTLKLKIRKKDAPLATAKFMGHGVCDNISKSVVLKHATNDPAIIAKECNTMSKALSVNPRDYRGVGIQMSRLENLQNKPEGTKTMESFLMKDINKEKTDNCFSNVGITASKSSKSTDGSIKRNTIKDLFTKQTNSPKKLKCFQEHVPSSELDQSVLDALPEDIRLEVLAAYPSKMSGNNGSVARNSKAGTSKSEKVIKKKITGPQKPSHKTQETLFPPSPINKPSEISEISSIRTYPLKNPSLAGAVELNDVRGLVKEWTESTQAPEEEDITQFKDYILEVADDDLESLDIIMNYFYRLARSLNDAWKQVYLSLIPYIRQRTTRSFGCTLQMKSEFPS